jgi:hypothetical protein
VTPLHQFLCLTSSNIFVLRTKVPVASFEFFKEAWPRFSNLWFVKHILLLPPTFTLNFLDIIFNKNISFMFFRAVLKTELLFPFLSGEFKFKSTLIFDCLLPPSNANFLDHVNTQNTTSPETYIPPAKLLQLSPRHGQLQTNRASVTALFLICLLAICLLSS